VVDPIVHHPSPSHFLGLSINMAFLTANLASVFGVASIFD
jgi:hypothetical protein